jgi:hypothetical protein
MTSDKRLISGVKLSLLDVLFGAAADDFFLTAGALVGAIDGFLVAIRDLFTLEAAGPSCGDAL